MNRRPGFARHVAALLAACGMLPVLHAAPLEQLGWLAGCWNAVGGEPGSGEQWTSPAGGAMLGMSRTIKGGKLKTYEFMRIAATDDGTAVFHAQPAGQPAASFSAIKLDATEVVFENLQHDFPQRVIYRFEAPERLHASIEGTLKGALKRIEFPLVRAACQVQIR
ncbi:DUF6265 family protein [Duganella aceris]|uniref:DUF6265 domain-containing protein n=1 Tax=Duganella aceris TaxID=2703883 RepID=A0ABX0FIA8_9BURK|nr:DUF6265 family protein [Duganella aceris]NGZ84294.1 hypothetical protein [Duganella aceris]